jgi:hypothetical protein
MAICNEFFWGHDQKSSGGYILDEYVEQKNVRADPTNSNQCKTSEPSTSYAIVAILRKGYKFGQCKEVKVVLDSLGGIRAIARATIQRPADHVDGTKEDVYIDLSQRCLSKDAYTRVVGGNLCFAPLATGAY